MTYTTLNTERVFDPADNRDAAADGPSSPAPFRLFTEGDCLYDDMLTAIAGAQHHVLLESYIFADDEIGRRFLERLAERAAAGITVRLHIDAAGSLFWRSHALARRLKGSGVQLRWFHRWDWRHPWRYNRRNHRKLLVVDGLVAYVGGFNIHRENSRRLYGEQRWRDTHVRLHGRFSVAASELFGRFWSGHKRPAITAYAEDHDALLSNFTRGARRYLNGRFARLLTHARQRIYLSTPYFVPDRGTQRRIIAAARRGVDVRVLVPRKNDVRLAQWAARAAYDDLLANGVRIYEYLPRLLHAKCTVVDGRQATLGTSNFDYRSVFINYELNLFTSEAALCAELESVFLRDLADSEEIRHEHWRRRPFGGKLLELIGWLARRWL